MQIDKIKKRFDSPNRKIDYSDTEQLAKDVWLFLTDDKMPARANIKKEAFLHEVKCMLDAAIMFNQPKKI